MSAAFALDFSGDPVPEKKPVQWTYDRHCVVCGVPFTVLGADPKMIFSTCGSQECLLHFARHNATPVPVLCRCPQREFPHELSIHFELRTEAYNPKLKFHWPWSLCASARLEPSAERKA